MTRRRRWWGFGMASAIAVTAGAGGIWIAHAGSPNASSFVPITPCRLLDTRPGGDNVGTRQTPLGPNDSYTAPVWGTNGNCTIPTGATGVSMNVVAIAPTAASFLTVYPADQSRPLAASLNWTAGQAPTPNAVTAALSANGQLALYNLTGSVHLAVDIVGYYEAAAAGAQGPPGPVGPAGPTGPQGVPAPRSPRELRVATTGGDYATVSAALAAIGTTLPSGTANLPYVIDIAPGTYTEPASIQLKDHVSLHGSGQQTTILEAPSGAGASAALRIDGTVSTTIRDLAVRNTDVAAIGAVGIRIASTGVVALTGVAAAATGSQMAVGIDVVSGSPSLTDVDARASADASSIAISITTGSASLTHAHASSTGSGITVGMRVVGGTPIFTESTVSTTGGTNASGIQVTGGSPVFDGGRFIAAGDGFSVAIDNTGAGTTTIRDAEARGTASTPGNQWGVFTQAGTLVLDGVSVSTNAGGVGAQVNAGGTVLVVRSSSVDGPFRSIDAGAGTTTRVSSSTLSGGSVSGTGTYVCRFDVDEAGVSLTNVCGG